MARYWPKGYWPEGYWPDGYWPDDEIDEGGSWWWPEYLQRAFGILPPEIVPEPIAALRPEPVVGSGIAVLPRFHATAVGVVELPVFEGMGEVVVPAISAGARANHGEVATGHAQLGVPAASARGTYAPTASVAIEVPAFGAQATALLIPTSHVHGILGIIEVKGTAEYQVCSEQELLELVALAVEAFQEPGPVEIQIDGVTEIELEELSIIAVAAQEHLDHAGA